ncbi:signal peptidase I [Vagococcus zengguangii]|uniref:Signal peptidase I n=1 Tax=Vagococcus zengguangii TaxID=2571750 RepID=A0A4D7CXL7_9ENTE|nr:signal peptidase I [Vagococcus zengguangii]QCI86730.1 signal peptidase I [Vagococcus zengguangii]TLG79510.1 signal peptidase I [Vagococcus zengguangii]
MKKNFILIALSITVTCLLIYTNLFKIHLIEGKSMEPTVHNNEAVLLRKTNKISRYVLIGFEDELAGNLLLKRVIGMPGDSYIIASNQLILTEKEENNFSSVSKFQLDENVAKELSHYNMIPENQYFVVGDNRGISNDSRKLGFVNKEDIEGEVIYRIFPLNRIGRVK